MITKLSPDNTRALNISSSDIIDLFKMIVASYRNNGLELSGVIKPWQDDFELLVNDENAFFENVNCATLQLIFLAKHIRCFVHKDLISQFVHKYISAGLDQQPRHLGSQKFWYILNKSAKVPNSNEKVPSGYHYLFTLDSPNPAAISKKLKRVGRLAATNFVELKAAYGNLCATCHQKEGSKDLRTQQTIVLQQGHMDPNKPLTIQNTIPQCQFCNQTYKDNFSFDENGRVKAISNPLIINQSSVAVQKAVYDLLKVKFK